MKKPVSMRDIAEPLGVHPTTVSMALRDHPRISPEMRARVRKLADELGYRPNPLVAALMHHRRARRQLRTQATLAWVTSFPTRHGWKTPEMEQAYAAAVRRAHSLGFGVDVHWATQPGLSPARFRRILLARGITGLIVARLPLHVHRLELDLDGLAAVGFGVTLQEPELHRVAYHHFDVVGHAIDLCHRRGYRRPGLALLGGYEPVDEARCGAYHVARDRWPELRALPVFRGAPGDARGFLAWFRKHAPDVILTPSASWVVETLRAARCSVPRHVGVVSLDLIAPDGTISGFAQTYDQLAVACVDLLVSMLYRNERGLPSQPQKVLILGSWVEGTTLLAPRVPAA